MNSPPANPRFHPARLAAALVLCAALMLCAASAHADAAALPTGVSNTAESSLKSFKQVKATGATYVKIELDWNSTVPTPRPSNWNPENPDDPNYEWGQWDTQVKNAVAAGLKPVIQLGGPPKWAQGCQTPSAFPYAVCDPSPTDLHAFAAAAARHYSGSTSGIPAVKYFQILNEPNLTLFFLPQFSTAGKPLSAGLYRKLLNAAYSGIKSVSKKDIVIAAGLGPIAVPKYTIGPMQFARELFCLKGKKNRKAKGNCEGGVHADIVAIQPYTTGGPTHKGHADDVELGDLPKFQSLIAAADKAGRLKGRYGRTPLWVTEFSWDTKPPDPGGLPMAIENRWVAEALYVAYQAKVANFFWFSLHDANHHPGESYAEATESGLYFANNASGKAKPILTAFRFPFVAYPKGGKLTFWGRTPNSKGGNVAVQLLEHGTWKTVSRLTAKAGGVFAGTIRTTYGADQKGDARAVFKGGSSIPFAMKPVPDFNHQPFGG